MPGRDGTWVWLSVLFNDPEIRGQESEGAGQPIDRGSCSRVFRPSYLFMIACGVSSVSAPGDASMALL